MIRVQSLGEHQDPAALVGEVKLEEGANIRIDRDDAHNSLIITSTLTLPPHCATALFYDLAEAFAPAAPSPIPAFAVVGGGWKTPDSHLDPSEDWADEIKAYDNNVATYARSLTKKYNAWTTYLELHVSAPIYCTKLRFMCDTYKRDSASVDIFYGGDWPEVYTGFDWLDDTWYEVEFEGQTIEKARFRTHSNATGQYGLLWEFDFWETF